MQVTRKSRFHVRAQNIIFTLLFLISVVLVAWLTNRYSFQTDWTAGHRNTLTTASQKLLATLKNPVEIEAIARNDNRTRDYIRELIGKYQRVDSKLSLKFINPDTDPELIRRLNITREGTLIIHYNGRTEKVDFPSENTITNAIQRLARSTTRWIVFLAGHGERNPHGRANFDLGDYGRELQSKGFKLEGLNLAQTPAIPDNTAVLVIAGPQTNLLPGETKIIQEYVKHGGNLLWLGDPGNLHGLQPLEKQLGISFDKGTVVDASIVQLLGINKPTVVMVTHYEPGPLTSDFTETTLIPDTTSLSYKKTGDWQENTFLKTSQKSWLEAGKLSGVLTMDTTKGDKPGPLPIGITLTREIKSAAPKSGKPADSKKSGHPTEQRIVVMGGGNFLSNAYLNNGGNVDLGLNIMNWLSHDDSFIDINLRKAPDLTLSLNRTESTVISVGFLFLLPGILLTAGIMVWLRRRRR